MKISNKGKRAIMRRYVKMSRQLKLPLNEIAEATGIGHATMTRVLAAVERGLNVSSRGGNEYIVRDNVARKMRKFCEELKEKEKQEKKPEQQQQELPLGDPKAKLPPVLRKDAERIAAKDATFAELLDGVSDESRREELAKLAHGKSRLIKELAEKAGVEVYEFPMLEPTKELQLPTIQVATCPACGTFEDKLDEALKKAEYYEGLYNVAIENRDKMQEDSDLFQDEIRRLVQERVGLEQQQDAYKKNLSEVTAQLREQRAVADILIKIVKGDV